MVYWEATVLRTQNVSLHWPTVTGTILQSSRTYVPNWRGGHYRVEIIYRYEVNRGLYSSSQMSLWSPNLSSYDTKGFVSARPTGSQVTVYYDPNQFANAVLIPGANEAENGLLIAMGGLSVIAGLVGIVMRLRRQPVLEALLNTPDAQTRTIKMRKADIEKGINGSQIFILSSAVFGMIAVSVIMIPLSNGPILEGRTAISVPHPIMAVATVLGCVFFLFQAMRELRRVKCPLCGNLLNKSVFTKARCDECGTRIIFKDPHA